MTSSKLTLWETCIWCVAWVFSWLYVRLDIIDRVEFTSYSAAFHQRAIKTCCPHICGGLMSSIFIYSQSVFLKVKDPSLVGHVLEKFPRWGWLEGRRDIFLAHRGNRLEWTSVCALFSFIFYCWANNFRITIPTFWNGVWKKLVNYPTCHEQLKQLCMLKTGYLQSSLKSLFVKDCSL